MHSHDLNLYISNVLDTIDGQFLREYYEPLRFHYLHSLTRYINLACSSTSVLCMS